MGTDLRQLLCGLCMQTFATVCGAATPQLLDVQVNAHWRDDLRQHSATTLDQRRTVWRAAGEEGCRRYCGLLGETFARVMQAARSQDRRAEDIPWTLVVTRSATDEAYALPDGHIVISETWIEREELGREELAFVLAHEASHVLLAHQADTLDLVMRVAPLGITASVDDIYNAMDVDIAVLLRIAPLMVAMEEDADRTGLMLVALAGFDPELALGYVRRLAAGGHTPGIVATHPHGGRRLKLLQDFLPLAKRIHERFASAH